MDGGWTDWEDWTPCSQTCGTGSQERERSCTQPPPAFGGKDCVGVSRETKSCQARVCPGKTIVLTFSTEAWLPLRPLANTFEGFIHVSIFVSFIFQWLYIAASGRCLFSGFATCCFSTVHGKVPLGPNSYQSSPFLSFESPTALFASQHNLLRTM